MGGKYGIVFYEIFIVAASVTTLRRGTTRLGRKSEALAHFACGAISFTVFIAFGVYMDRMYSAI